MKNVHGNRRNKWVIAGTDASFASEQADKPGMPAYPHYCNCARAAFRPEEGETGSI
jgi:hypothetical protein